MTDPIEAVARAILATLDLPEDQFRRPVSDAMACAAIAAFLDAVREPSEGMQEAALDLRMDSPYTDAWTAMLDACREEVLGEEPTT